MVILVQDDYHWPNEAKGMPALLRQNNVVQQVFLFCIAVIKDA
jgi:hypothetical protein